MKQILAIILSLISLSAFSQQLNKLGKIEVDEIPQMPDHRIQKEGGDYKVIKDSFVFEGNTFFDIPNGFITSLEVVDDNKDYIKQYDANGKLLATILSDRVINLKISEDGEKVVYFDKNNIIHIDITTYKVDTLPGSLVYEFVKSNKLIYYDSDNNAIWFNGSKIEIEQYPNQFIEYNGKVYIITKSNIFELIGNSLNSKYEFRGEFFDSKIINDEFYFVDKEEKRKKEAFTLYKTSDFVRIIMIDKLDELNQ